MSDAGRQRIANIFALLGANVIGRGLTLLYVMVVARALGLEGFGQLATVTAYLAICGVLSDFGLSRLVVRDVARHPVLARSYLAQSLVVRVVLASLAYAALVAGVAVAGYPAEVRGYFWIGGLSLLPGALALAFMAILNAQERMGQVSVLSTLVGVVTLTTAWPILHAGWGVSGLLAALTLVNLLQAALAGWWVWRAGLPGGRPRRLSTEGMWRLFLRGCPYAGFNILSIVYVRAAAVILSVLQGPEAVGLYMAAFRLVEAFALVPLALVNALFPLMAVQALAGPGGSLGRTYGQAVRVLGLLALPLAAGTTLLAGPAVEIVYGASYGEAAGLLGVLVWGLALLYLNAPVGNVILGSDFAGRFLPWAASHTGASAVVTALLASRYGPRGAAWAFVLAELSGFGLQLWFVRPIVGPLPSFPRILARPALATLIMSLVIGGLRLLGVHLLFLVPVGVLVYFGTLLALGEIRQEDRAHVRAWLLQLRLGSSVGIVGGGGV